MFTRRTFIAASGAALAAPSLARAAQIEPKFRPQSVTIAAAYAPNQILILPRAHFLYFVTEPRRALRYGVGVGKAGLEFTGKATIDVKKEWPTWRPTNEMIEREPRTYAKFKDNDYVQPGGPGNPLGARALYLFQNGRDTFYRIHGTTEPGSIGRSVSNGCIRMINDHVIDLYEKVPVGAPVTVL
ncbi:L,D-transpeptidase [Lutimaribacter sp. EGI FJ00015]|uniref:L,D-transpeptidase n=1 Tax=Lutimaribacter degradans TaxID=2945989 RepID=A0ACC5ZU64_9RHOB|nr:L,D-transpeptidase [Lutimaribacter sp. EGI FJ00013]MCM2561730.1 L,D-transpeptidase [Lutimaribacter sp. EGI FJ00013]MCO0612557.1 L,D-transpeptidase [Lutimaribacter sp. EGI FJ00015]MCO0635216.1 L,D-transpeptidase [Lutimaribacter sp. EGI FJ00014]